MTSPDANLSPAEILANEITGKYLAIWHFDTSSTAWSWFVNWIRTNMPHAETMAEVIDKFKKKGGKFGPRPAAVVDAYTERMQAAMLAARASRACERCDRGLLPAIYANTYAGRGFVRRRDGQAWVRGAWVQVAPHHALCEKPVPCACPAGQARLEADGWTKDWAEFAARDCAYEKAFHVDMQISDFLACREWRPIEALLAELRARSGPVPDFVQVAQAAAVAAPRADRQDLNAERKLDLVAGVRA